MSIKLNGVSSLIFSVTASLLPLTHIFAAGMVPETTLLVIEESQQGGTINLTNTDGHPVLMYTTITDLPDDKGTRVNVTQPVVRVEPNQQQQLRFILETQQPLTVEHYKRVCFESIPPKKTGSNAKVSFNIRQDLPVLIRPKNLPVVTDAWKFLKWSVAGNSVKVNNPSPYVVRLADNVTFLPSRSEGRINKTYILPGETLDVTTKATVKDQSVKFYPASRYGIEVPDFTAQLVR